MADEWIMVMSGVVVIVVAFSLALMIIQREERRSIGSKYKMLVYSELLHAVTELNLAGDDQYRICLLYTSDAADE